MTNTAALKGINYVRAVLDVVLAQTTIAEYMGELSTKRAREKRAAVRKELRALKLPAKRRGKVKP